MRLPLDWTGSWVETDTALGQWRRGLSVLYRFDTGWVLKCIGPAKRLSETEAREWLVGHGFQAAAGANPAQPDLNAYCTPKDMAERYSVNPEALRGRLRAFRKGHFDGWQEVPDPKPREARYLYRLGDVLPIIEALQASGETSGERPAK